eukprot:3555077-Lingulodinium_polyedra.AAC.1
MIVYCGQYLSQSLRHRAAGADATEAGVRRRAKVVHQSLAVNSRRVVRSVFGLLARRAMCY